MRYRFQFTRVVLKARSVIDFVLQRIWRWFVATSHKVAKTLDLRMEGLIGSWAALLLACAAFKVLTAPTLPHTLVEALAMAFPFIALGASPVLGYRLAASVFPKGRISQQPTVRLALYGNWREADHVERRAARITRPAGFLVSLLVGVLLNVPFRTIKFLIIVPATAPTDPVWGQLFVLCFTLQATFLNFLYMTSFVMGLRCIPQFPRMLLFVWLFDILSQLVMAQALGAVGLPRGIAPLLIHSLQENVVHVLIAVALWLPYLLLSDQVNLRYRWRMRRRSA